MVNQVNLGKEPRLTMAAAPQPPSKAYVDFAKDCHRQRRFHSGNPEQRRRPICSRLPRKYGTDGVRGNRIFDSPGRLSVPFAETKGTCNCTELFGNVHTSMLCGSVTRWLPQSLRDSSLPEGTHMHSDGVELYRCSNGDSFRHPLKRMPPPSGREALYTLMLQCKIRFFYKLKRL